MCRKPIGSLGRYRRPVVCNVINKHTAVVPDKETEERCVKCRVGSGMGGKADERGLRLNSGERCDMMHDARRSTVDILVAVFSKNVEAPVHDWHAPYQREG